MFGLNSNDEKDDKFIMFIDICDFIDVYLDRIRLVLMIIVFIYISFQNFLPNFFLRILFSVPIGNILSEILCFFTIDRRYSVIYKHLKYPLIVDKLDINKEDEMQNIGSDNPKIPGIDFVYDIKRKADDKFAVAFQVDESHFKILTFVDCPDVAKNKRKKIESDILLTSFEGLKKEYILSNQCLVMSIVKLKKDVEELDIIEMKDIDDTLIITECVYYPYIK